MFLKFCGVSLVSVLVVACATAGTPSPSARGYEDPKVKLTFSNPSWKQIPGRNGFQKYQCEKADCGVGSTLRARLSAALPGEKKRIADGEINAAYVENKGRTVAREKAVKYEYSKVMRNKKYAGSDIMLSKGGGFRKKQYQLARTLFTDKTSIILTSRSTTVEQTQKNMELLFSSLKILN